MPCKVHFKRFSSSIMRYHSAALLYAVLTLFRISQATLLTSDCTVLSLLYNSTNGLTWHTNTNWNLGSCCSWAGISCGTFLNATRVTNVGLQTNNLTGPFLDDICNLTALNYLNLWGNQLSGSIPSCIGNLTQLTYLDFSWNLLTGPLPPVGNLIYLTYLGWNNNQFIGSISSDFCNLTSLWHVSFSGNQLSGPLPACIGNWTHLTYMDLSYNSLTGAIPATVGNLNRLQQLWIGNNQLSGSIPGALCNIASLTELGLNNNQLTVAIPECIGNLTQLLYIYFEQNDLSGPLPSSLCSLLQLNVLQLSTNRFSGSLPTCLGNMNNLAYVSLDTNNFGGSIPTTFCNLTNLNQLFLQQNSITGNIPSCLGQLTNLKTLNLQSNALSGSVPNQLCCLTQTAIDVSNNSLTGSIPACFVSGSGCEPYVNAKFSGNSFSWQLSCAKSSCNNLLESPPPTTATTTATISTNASSGSASGGMTLSATVIASIGGAGAIVACTLIATLLFIRRNRQHAKKQISDRPSSKANLISANGVSVESQSDRQHKTESAVPTLDLHRLDTTEHTSYTAIFNQTLLSTTLMNTSIPVATPGFKQIQDASYRVVRKIAEGGGGAVYQGEILDLRSAFTTQRQVAVKKITNFRDLSTAKIAFEQEVAITAALSSNQYFVPFVAYVDFPHPALLTKWYPMGALAGFIHSPQTVSWTSELVGSLSFDIAMGLAYMHKQGIAHCDLKPANVLIENNDAGRLCCRISDFGCAVFVKNKLLQVKAFQVSTARGLSVQYASPEVLKFLDTNQGDFTFEADIFSAGIIVWELVTRSAPWKDVAIPDVMQRVIHGERLSLPGSPFDAIIRQCWDADPSWRPSADMLAAKLQ
jgi:Leucine-rich repeat (LRR) protein